jgi:BolA family transcriptional regulator, general stress-responsive regulator
MNVKVEIERRLRAALAPQRLEVIDESDDHRGHTGHLPGTPTHFRVLVRAETLAGLGRLERQREVYAAVGDLMGDPVHALAIDAAGPEQADRTAGQG